MAYGINLAWKDGELAYCMNLAQRGGDDNVGYTAGAIESYLRLQAICAKRDGEHAIEYTLLALVSAIPGEKR